MMNYLYELDAYCTSIIARMSNGTLILARNLDFYFPDETRKTLYIGKFYRGDNYIFEATMFAGVTGVYTGMRPKAFALSINERTKKETTFNFFDNLAMLFSGHMQVGMLSRKALTECNNYECAVQLISSEKNTLIAGGYFIISGLSGNDGVIITRDRTSVLDVTSLNSSKTFIVQTNQDHYKGDCPIRCEKANERMNTLASNISSDLVLAQVLTQWPNLNLFSIYATVYLPQTGYSFTEHIYATDQTDPGDII